MRSSSTLSALGNFSSRLLDLSIALANNLDVSDEARATELGEDLISELAEDSRDIADLMLTLLGSGYMLSTRSTSSLSWKSLCSTSFLKPSQS